MLEDVGVEGQEALKAASVLVVGAGGLGCPALQYLTAAGIGTIGIVEFDMVNESNIHRQILYGANDIGKLKSIIAKSILRNRNDKVNIEIFNLRLTGENAAKIFAPYDIVLDATDNYETRYVIDDACSESGKPMVHGAIYKHEAQVSVFNYNGGPSYRGYNPPEGAKRDNPDPSQLGLFGVLPGIAGVMMASEALKIVVKAGDILSGRVLIFDLMTNRYYTIDI